MLKRSHRFHGYNSVLPVYKQAKSARFGGCSLHYRENPKRKNYRLAVVVSKKVSKSAVKRNRIRRRIYNTVVNEIDISRPFDLIITAYDVSLATTPQPELKQTLEQLFSKSKITP